MMAGLPETETWEADVYQIEQTDPVVGGPPNLGLGQGITNVPHAHLANRTAWLKAQVEAIQAALGGLSYATQADIDAAISALIDGAPGALDTLNELAAAMTDDADFAATVTASLAGKLAQAMNLSDLADPDAALINLGLTAAMKAFVTGAAGPEIDDIDDITKPPGVYITTPEMLGTGPGSNEYGGVLNLKIAWSGIRQIWFDVNGNQIYHRFYLATSGGWQPWVPLYNTHTQAIWNAGTDAEEALISPAVLAAVLANLIDAAPGTLDTLNELAAALGDDPNFASTIAGQIAAKLDGSAYTAADVLSKIKTVGGAGSNLDADLLDGQHAADILATALTAAHSAARDELQFRATLDVTDPAPTNVRGGVFNDLATLVAASAPGSRLVIGVAVGTTVNIDTDIQMVDRDATFNVDGVGANPVFAFGASSNGSVNQVASLVPRHGGEFNFKNIDFALPTAKPDPALAWQSSSTPVLTSNASEAITIRLGGSTVTGGVANELSLLSPGFGGTLNANLRGVTADGPFNVVGLVDEGVANISTHQLTLANGAVLQSGGTLGTTYLTA
jgi:hypothetical protein